MVLDKIISWTIEELQKTRKSRKRKFISIIAGIFLIYVIYVGSNIIGELTNSFLVNPLVEPVREFFKSKMFSVEIEPILLPLVSASDNQLLRVNFENNGTLDLENVRIDYAMPCLFNGTKRQGLAKVTLKPTQSDYFEFEGLNRNESCSIATEPVAIQFYKDSKGKLYSKTVNSTSKVCVYCQLSLNISTTNGFFTNFSYWYPFFEGNVSLELFGGYTPYEKATNKSDLKYVDTIGIWIVDINTACLRGEINCTDVYGKPIKSVVK